MTDGELLFVVLLPFFLIVLGLLTAAVVLLAVGVL